ncbi:putative signal transducing protein [Winogradskyella rapida]|uniref:DUF2007 domain-containing protein n=1 Tax=Winogradskyella rapida TaxID=549701 RepID=A0ABW3KSL6_9FLAO
MHDTFVTIAKYQYSTEAEIIKGRLESEGISVFLKDNITIDTDPLVSQAIGGIKLNVLAKDEAQAVEILQAIQSYSMDNDGQPLKCPNCGNNHIRLYSTINNVKALVSFLISFLTGTIPFSTRYQYQCEDCKTNFPIKA